MVGIAELLRERRQPPERVAHLHLVAHAHAAMQLNRFLADRSAGLGNSHLGGGYDA